MTYFGRFRSKGECSNEDLTKVEFDAFMVMLSKWEEVCLTIEEYKIQTEKNFKNSSNIFDEMIMFEKM